MSTKYFGGMDLAQIGTLTAATIVSLGLITASALQVTNYSRFTAISVTQDFYLDPAGSDTNNNCQTLASPCLTPQHVQDVIAASMESGAAVVHMAAGTYTGGLYLYDMLAASSTKQAANAIPQGGNMVTWLGDTTTPNNVVLSGSSTVAGIIEARNVKTTHYFNGIKINGDATSSSTNSGLYASGKGTTIILNNVNIDNVARWITADFGSNVYVDSGTTGGTWRSNSFGVVAGTQAFVRFNAPISNGTVMTGNGIFTVSANAWVQVATTGSTWNFQTFGSTGAGMIQPSGSNAYFSGFGSGDVINAHSSGTSVYFMRAINGGRLQPGAGSTYNLFGFTTGGVFVDDNSFYYESGSNTWNYLNGTPSVTGISPSGVTISGNALSSATVSYTAKSANSFYGYDNTYLPLSASTISFGNAALGTGSCTSTVTSVTGADTTMSVQVTPVTYPGDGVYWKAVLGSGSVTTYACAATTTTPTASIYRIRVTK